LLSALPLQGTKYFLPGVSLEAIAAHQKQVREILDYKSDAITALHMFSTKTVGSWKSLENNDVLSSPHLIMA
jgi:hypothetical protein